MKKLFITSMLTAVCIMASGCASIVDGGRKSVKIDSTPTGAKVTVFNANGTMVDSVTTPAKIKLERSQGYFKGQDYKLVFEAPGFYPGEAHIEHKIDGWYFGNILFGGLVGFLAVDPLTGAMYTLSPRDLNYTLVSSSLNLSPEEVKAAQLKANPVDKKKAASNNTTGPKK